MINTVHIDRLAIYARHGVLPQERVVGAMFYVTLCADVEVLPCAYVGDELEGTVSYADIIACVQQEMSVPAKLLEHLAYRMGQRILQDFPAVQTLNLRIDKENPPCGVSAESIGVSLCLKRDNG